MVHDQQRTVWTVITALVVIVLVVISVMAYQSVNVTETSDDSNNTEVDYVSNQAVRVSLSLPRLIKGGHYALWGLTEENQPFLIREFGVDQGNFLVGLEGELIASTFTTDGRDLSDVVSFIVSVETGEKTNTAPSDTLVLETNNQRNKTFTLAFPHDLTELAGSFILATPSNGPDSNETSGVWFVRLTGNQEEASLNIPTAPEGWVYQAWATHNDVRLNIGQFTVANNKDDFSNFSGPRSFPNFPGEDFLTNAPAESTLTFPLDLTDGQGEVVMNLEPTDEENFYPLTILRADIAEGAEPRVSIDLENVFTPPSGTVQILTK